MRANDISRQAAKRNPLWIALAVLLMIVCAYCVGEWRLIGRLAVNMPVRSDLAGIAQHMTTRSKQFGIAALILFPALVLFLGSTDPRARSGAADRLRGYLRGFVFAVLGTAGFLILEAGLVWMLIRNMHLQ